MKNQKGFTIIELIVVVATIAVLAAIIISNVNKYAVKARDVKRKADLTQMKKAMLMWAVDHDGKLPTSGFGDSGGGNGWATNRTTDGSCYSYTLESVLAGRAGDAPRNLYMQTPRDPNGGCWGIDPSPGGYMYYWNSTSCATLFASLENPSAADLNTCNSKCYGGMPGYGMNYCFDVKTQ
jgi:prepilin-type N-terminal cleavage/methylation domain-containing protein